MTTVRSVALLVAGSLTGALVVHAAGDVPAAGDTSERAVYATSGSGGRSAASLATFEFAEPENPPPAHTGGFGEPTCQACHFEAELNAGPGAVELHLPDVVAADSTYRITVRLTHPGMRRAGFMLSTRTKDGAQAGMLRAVDERTTTTAAGDVVYIHHTRAGTHVSGDSHEWTLEWSTDGVDGPVVVNVAANAANDDASAFGDWVYARAFDVTARGQAAS